jgi:peptidyl-prolyl cis-trans isomerase SurA
MVRLKEREVSSRVNVTEGEIDNFLQTQATSALGNDEYSIAHILVRVPENFDTLQIEQKRQRAESALAKLKEGAEFAQIAAEYSDADDALRGGVMDWRPVAQMGPRFAELLSAMQPGELTQIIQSPIGFHILKLLDRRAQQVPVVIVDQTHVRHILIKVNELTSESDALQLIHQLKERIDNGASFEELAKLHSEDNSASSGGDLVWISPGVTVPAFEKAMKALRPGDISEPVQTPFGWHLIQVIERRSQDVSDEQQRHNAREAIHTRKADVIHEEWLQQLRDQAYVENRLEDG